MKYRNIKIDVSNCTEEEKKKVQEVLFKDGCSWRGDKTPKYFDVPFLFVDKDGYLSWDDDRGHFNSVTKTDVKSYELLSFTKKDLKDGMVVTYECGEKRIIIIRSLRDLDDFSCGSHLDNFNEDLTHEYINGMNIMKVEYMGEVLWEREEEESEKDKEIKRIREEMEKLAKDLKELEESV